MKPDANSRQKVSELNCSTPAGKRELVSVEKNTHKQCYEQQSIKVFPLHNLNTTKKEKTTDTLNNTDEPQITQMKESRQIYIALVYLYKISKKGKTRGTEYR